MTKGYVVASYHKSGGGIATWKPTLKAVFEFLEGMGPHDSISIVPCDQNNVKRYVVNEAIGHLDSGISTPSLRKEKILQ